ncbi:hypothetical protein SAMN04515671_0836 [Nakamurella panacisegetis]|uniref:DUF6457 domain-containing protein n=1 Tax=Nakamurella panacisegetis TaxID=1090615 RepID=A0A1H0JAF5_9ACTN|nr:DUF6457 domain-containing protein [Nakamurella panacisegetis]SDO40530.1 hypothetical protein SAMN04515671_0836 [Nakamurella panacisegetis]
MSTLDDWMADAAQALALPPAPMTVDLRDDLLDLTREVAHGVARIAGPLTCYLVGLAVANGMSPTTAVQNLRDVIAARPSTQEGSA